ncbi:hypothetical protein MOQ72_04160 [Saccharopolyspora sp. K220]|uniref:hypothetical protein n=1 Tax=Saccharopolyspora soli TaxID=2926618 RepID=UPI001F59C30E|nr:hypothetical protein [Saccharopolyspora soli]MCI2416606.1 hypothetical protein [Saccharopolyspora soli]
MTCNAGGPSGIPGSRSARLRYRPAQQRDRLPSRMGPGVHAVRLAAHPRRVLLCSVLGTLTVRSWVSLPLLFLGSVAGVAALLDLLFEQNPAPNDDLSLSAPLLFGFAAGLSLLSGSHVRWSFQWQRRGLRFTYPLLMVACALATDGLQLPVFAALTIGPVAAALLAVLLIRAYQDRDAPECAQAPVT